MSYNEPPPPPPQYGQPSYGGDQPTGTSKKATWSLVSGIVSLLCCGPLGILAIVLGRQAQAEIATTGQQGAGLAKAGFILGIVALVFFVIQIIVFASGGVDFDFSTS
ncbi:DUF4190 domain-containing protein [Nocardioides sp. SOB44]|jgi:hypothetical protein|uniref:DUF4190 domain-containing protein n=1 Tax=Nocardioides cremeus TaxID=3058044 RepID=A0ABT8TLZ4_9ACTN|nr:DUF4190 domain-containing protein [Nocardioides cremeus]MDO3394990.1 DUF4190 domain-containing protein [Nocardioides cremeus]